MTSDNERTPAADGPATVIGSSGSGGSASSKPASKKDPAKGGKPSAAATSSTSASSNRGKDTRERRGGDNKGGDKNNNKGEGKVGKSSDRRNRRGGNGGEHGGRQMRRRKRKNLLEGVLKLKYDDKGFGFISNEQVSKEFDSDLFAHRRNFKPDEWDQCARGDTVKFYLKTSEDGKPQAHRVRYAGDPGVLAERVTEGKGKKKQVYQPYWSPKDVMAGLRDGSLTEGTLRVNPKKPTSAYVDLGGNKKDGEKDWLVLGYQNRNRAVHGDRVVVRLLPQEEGEVEKEEEERDPEEEDDEEAPDTDLQHALEDALLAAETEEKLTLTEKSPANTANGEVERTPRGAADTGADESEDADSDDDDEIEGGAASSRARNNMTLNVVDALLAPELLEPEAQPDEEQHGFRLAQVVYIGDYSGRNRTYVCTLCPNNVEGTSGKTSVVKETEKFVKAMPVDKKYPWILIYLKDEIKAQLGLTPGVPGKVNKFMYWAVKIQKWDETSILPLGSLAEKPIGEAGDAQAEVIKALEENELMDHNKNFDDEMLDEVDAIVAHTTENFERIAAQRMDLRAGKRDNTDGSIRVMTIDPKTARDLDDAIHVKKISSEITEFGVHIADVGHFVKPGSRVDKEAKFRCTSVYMPDRVLPMLPHALCNHLCSLNPNETKCAFSCFFRINKAGQLMVDKENEPWIAKTVINTCCRFNYDQVQELYDGKTLEGDERPEVYHGAAWEACVSDLFLIYRVCTKIRTARFSNGALAMHKSKLIFKTTDDNFGKPTGYATEVHSASHWVIEELMLLANKAVARLQQRHELFDTLAVLRNHPPPDEKKSKRVLEVMGLCGIQYSNKDAGELHQCLQNIHKRYGPEVAATASMLTMKCGMRPAAYFIGEEESSHHFALNFDQYTHFTSPIRRYADVMVHRVLNAILEKKTKEQFLQEDLDDDDREAVPEKDQGLKTLLPDLNTDDLEEDEYDKHGRVKTGKALGAGRHRGGAGGDENKLLDVEGGEGEEKKSQANIAMTNQCKKCNGKKKASKDCQEGLDRAWFCMLLRGLKSWWYRAATVTEIEADGITVFAHEIGKEKKIMAADIRTKHYIPDLFVKEVKDEIFLPDVFEYFSKSHMKVTWTNRKVEDTQFLYGDDRPELEEHDGEIIGADVAAPPGMEAIAPEEQDVEQDIHLLSVVPIVLIPTKTVPIDFVMLLVSPFHPQWKQVKISEKERAGFNKAPVEAQEGGGDDAFSEDDYGTAKKAPKAAAKSKGLGKKRGGGRGA
ncbi:unnamed protein product [Amoebophrya sp. A25]|nr:unnamed protein product [Amoebophrya sp. A25]|eukprot:GSA25T00005161001.1